MDLSSRFQAHVLSTYSRMPVSFAKGKGARLVSTDGRRFLDFFAGLAVSNLGYAHPDVVKAMRRISKSVWHTSNLFEIPAQAELARLLQKGAGFAGKTFFANSGAEANEAAYKLVIKRGRGIHPAKTRVLAAVGSFHGRTMGALQLTGQEKYRANFAPFPGNVEYVIFNDEVDLERKMGPDVAGLFLEPIQGESGVVPATASYLKKARDLCSAHGALLVFDEVQTGCARTGDLFAFQGYGVVPDVFTAAKGLAAGVPISAMTVADAFAGVLVPGDHASTFGGNPLATGVSLAAMRIYADESFLADVRKRSELLRTGLTELRARHPFITDVRGRGFMLAFEIDGRSADRLKQSAFEKGLLVNSIRDRVVRLVPPLVLTKKDIRKGLEILDVCLAELEKNHAA